MKKEDNPQLENIKNLYEYILNLSTYDINELVEKSNSDEERKFYLKLEELKTQILQEKVILEEGAF